MKKRFFAGFFQAGLACVVACASSVAAAETQTYRFDKVHTQLHASVKHMGFSNSTARFLVKDGSIVLDPEKLTEAKVDVVIDAHSMDFGDATWKEHLSGEKWFNLGKYGEIRFTSSKVEKVGEGSLKVDGELTLKGTSKPVTLEVTVNGIGPHPFSKKPAVGFSALARFKRSDFGISEYVPMVGDEVTVRIEVEASAG